jgi:DNA-binding NarL/FixJ family response regulator
VREQHVVARIQRDELRAGNFRRQQPALRHRCDLVARGVQHFQQAVLAFTGQPAAAAQLRMESELTTRERRALQLLREGLSNARIADELGIAEKTVRNHLSNLYRKLGVRSRAEAIVRGRRQEAD